MGPTTARPYAPSPAYVSGLPPGPTIPTGPPGWLAEYTTELLNVVHVLTRPVALEPAQADLLDRISDGPTLDADAPRAEGASDAPSAR